MLAEVLSGHGFGQLTETLRLLGAEFADDLAFLGPRDLIEHGVEQQVAEDLVRHAGVLYDIHSRSEVQGSG